MATELIINASLPEIRIALVEEGEIQDLVIERPSDKGIVGNIYKGRVTRVLPGMQAAFVDIGLEKAAFLYVDEVYVHGNKFEEEVDRDSSDGSDSNEHPAEPAELSHEPELEQQQQTQDQVDPSEDSDEDSDNDSDENSDDDTSDDTDDDSDESSEGVEPPLENKEELQTESVDPSAVSAEPSSEGAEPPETSAEATLRFTQDRKRRGRRGGKNRNRKPDAKKETQFPKGFENQMSESGSVESDRSTLSSEGGAANVDLNEARSAQPGTQPSQVAGRRPEFKEQRNRDRRIRPKTSSRPARTQVNIQDLLQEGQEVLVQVSKDPIATKGARLTCHISLPGRHLVCMPTIDHVGVSRRIERDDERRRLRDAVERYRPANLGFIVRTASAAGRNSDKRIQQDIDYLANLWTEIRDRSSQASAPALIYEDLNPILRAIRDWVNEDIDKIVVDSRYHYNEITKFISHFMPVLKSRVELYQGDIPVFDAYGISTELSRALERRVWLKSGGYIVIDQAEALVAIDVNTGRFVGKRNLEDTILKTNLEAVQEIAYQLRLRNCGGIIIIDLIDMDREENRHRVYRALDEALKRDRARPTIQKISDLGLIEMTRKRTRDTIVRSLCEPCSHCEGKGFNKSKLTVAYEALREVEREGIERDIGKVLVQAHPDVIDLLAIDLRDTLDSLERRYRKQIYLQSIGDYHIEQFEVVSEKKENQRKQREEQNRSRRPERQERPERAERPERKEKLDRPLTPPLIANRGPEIVNDNSDSEMSPIAVVVKRSSPAPTDEDSVGNRANAATDVDSSQTAQPMMPMDEDFNEEDRLAYLRAQATQDAALARFASGAVDAPQGRPNRPAFNRGGGSGGQPRDQNAAGGGRNNNNRRGRNNNSRRGGTGNPAGGRAGGRFPNRNQGAVNPLPGNPSPTNLPPGNDSSAATQSSKPAPATVTGGSSDSDSGE